MIVVGLLVGLVVLIGLGVLGVGLLVLWGSGRNVWQRWAAFVAGLRSRSWAETSGTITRSVIQHRRSRNHVHYSAAIRYSYGAQGQWFVGERPDFVEQEGTFDAAQAVVQRYPVGSNVRVFYDAAAPRRSTLARNLPPVLLVSLGWLVVALVGLTLAGLGGDIVIGAFDAPPELGELPSLLRQLGGLLVGGGALAVAVAGIRALLERKTRRTLQLLAGAKLAKARDLRAGNRAAVFGRAEEDVAGANEHTERDEAEQEPDDGASELPLGEGTVFYLHSDLGSTDGDLTQVSPFVVRDETGEVSVELSPGQGLLCSQQVAIQGEVERWLDEHDLALGSSVPAGRRSAMTVERIREGDSVLIVGQACDAGASRVVLRAHAGEPSSLLFADLPLPDAITKLQRKPRATLALCAAGCLSIIVGAIALLV